MEEPYARERCGGEQSSTQDTEQGTDVASTSDEQKPAHIQHVSEGSSKRQIRWEPYTNDRLQQAIQRIARILGQDITTQNPILNTRLPDGSRLAVAGAPSSINGPTLTIRKFNRWFTSAELIESGSMPREVRDLIVGFMSDRKNGIISGGTGSGKTTLMKALLDHIPAHERLVIIEQPAELKVSHPNAVRWEAVEAIPGQDAITPSELLAAALRHRPDRIIFGEIRNESGYDLLQAMNTGHSGTLSTIPAKSAWDALKPFVQSCPQCQA